MREHKKPNKKPKWNSQGRRLLPATRKTSQRLMERVEHNLPQRDVPLTHPVIETNLPHSWVSMGYGVNGRNGGAAGSWGGRSDAVEASNRKSFANSEVTLAGILGMWVDVGGFEIIIFQNCAASSRPDRYQIACRVLARLAIGHLSSVWQC